MTDAPIDPAKLNRIASIVASVIVREAVGWASNQKTNAAHRAMCGLKEAENTAVTDAAGMCLVGLARAIEKNPQMLLAFAEIEKHIMP